MIPRLDSLSPVPGRPRPRGARPLPLPPDRVAISGPAAARELFREAERGPLPLEALATWRYRTPSRVRVDSLRVGPDGTLYVKAGRTVTALSPEGEEKWSRELSMAPSEFFHVAFPDGRQLFACDNFSNNFGYDSFQVVTPPGRVQDLDLPDTHLWEVDAVLPGGTVVLRRMDEVVHLRTRRDEELKKALRESLTGGPGEEAPAIVHEGDWVLIGGVRLPVGSTASPR